MLVKKKNSIYYTVMFFMIVIVGVGYAYFNSTISINGSTALAKNTWDVHFENAIVTDGSVESESSIEVDSSSTVVKFSARLDLPGDFYEFTIDVVNDGTIDAMLDEVVKSELSEVQAEYLTYNVSYVDGSEIKRSDKLATGNKETIIVRVEYIEDTTSTVVEENDQYLELSLSLLYTQYGKTVYSKNSLIGRMANEAVLDNVESKYVTASTGIGFGIYSSDTNGKGVYIRSGTENDRNPIYYYRGDVDNNNVAFANHCWKMVRSTETGGVKLIYNGEERYPPLKYDEYTNVSTDLLLPFEFDEETLKWKSTNNFNTSTISFSIDKEGTYFLTYSLNVSILSAAVFVDGNLVSNLNYNGVDTSTVSLGHLIPSNVVRVEFYNEFLDAGDFSFYLSRESDDNILCNNTGKNSQLENTSYYNNSNDALATVGYMYGTVYNQSSKILSSISNGVIFGNEVVYKNGIYTLNDTHALVDGEDEDRKAINTTYHYTCFSTGATCENVYYIYSVGYNDVYYITLSSGKKVEDAVDEMLTSSANENDSDIKKVIDGWYKSNLIHYTEKLEDTVWCNDRSVYSYGGFDKNGVGDLQFSSYARHNIDFNPSLECVNPNDRFTVDDSNGNGALTYPVALLTADEMVLAGHIVHRGGNAHINQYSYTGTPWFSMSPSQNNNVYSLYGGSLGHQDYAGIRPSISLKAGTEYVRGDGTPENPYIVE